MAENLRALYDSDQFRPWAGTTKRLQLSVGVPFFIDVNTVRLDRICGDHEVLATWRSPRFDHRSARRRKEGITPPGSYVNSA